MVCFLKHKQTLYCIIYILKYLNIYLLNQHLEIGFIREDSEILPWHD